jgi:hypothetical protein
MENYAVIEDGIVVNVIVYDGTAELKLPEGQTLQPLGDSGAWIGWKYNSKTAFEAPSS